MGVRLLADKGSGGVQSRWEEEGKVREYLWTFQAWPDGRSTLRLPQAEREHGR